MLFIIKEFSLNAHRTFHWKKRNSFWVVVKLDDSYQITGSFFNSNCSLGFIFKS